MTEKAVIVIPARLASTRLPRKMLLAETGKPLLAHTYEAAMLSKMADDVYVACDCDEIALAMEKFGAKVIMTDPDATSGTDRIAQAIQTIPDAQIIVNLQGDEPEMNPESIDRVIKLLRDNPQSSMATLATPIRDRETLEEPSCVKVVFDKTGRALYFSRSVIPHPRTWSDSLLSSEPPIYYLHLGIYSYRRDFLLDLAVKPRCELETTESLEQLRVLYEGDSILVGVVPHRSTGIDTPEDYSRFVTRMKTASRI